MLKFAFFFFLFIFLASWHNLLSIFTKNVIFHQGEEGGDGLRGRREGQVRAEGEERDGAEAGGSLII